MASKQESMYCGGWAEGWVVGPPAATPTFTATSLQRSNKCRCVWGIPEQAESLPGFPDNRNDCQRQTAAWVTRAGQWLAVIRAGAGHRTWGVLTESLTPQHGVGRGAGIARLPERVWGKLSAPDVPFWWARGRDSISSWSLGTMTEFSRNREQCSRPEKMSYRDIHDPNSHTTLMPPYHTSIPQTQRPARNKRTRSVGLDSQFELLLKDWE